MVIAFAFSTLLTGLAAAALAQSQGDRTSSPCESQLSDAGTTAGNLTLPNGSPFDVHRAMALFRFNRKKEALRELDSAESIVSGPWRWRINPERLKQLKASLNALRNCVARSEPPAMATLTIDAFLVDPAAGEPTRKPVAGATVKVEDIPVGQTEDDGRMTMRVPSGAIRVTAELAPTTWGEGYVTLPPGGSERLSLPLDDGKEVTEDTDLVVAEAVDDIIPVTSRSFTLKFMRGDRLAPVVRVRLVELLDCDDNFERNLEELFTVTNGAITANRTAEAFDSLARHAGETITLSVYAEDAADRTHQDRVRFRLGLSRLVVTLAPPPSNPALPVSNIEVGVSLIGTGIAVQRVSDREGRFEIDALPHGTIALDCETVSGGVYYYCGGTMAHWGDQSMILVPLHVSDLRAGVPPLTLQSNAAAAPHVERRKPGQ
jgi:hypothetical protein